MLDKIKRKIVNSEKKQLSRDNLRVILKKHKHLLTSEEVDFVKKELEKLEDKSISSDLCVLKKHKDFMFSKDEIENADETKWLVQNIIPRSTIGVFVGESGSGKSTVVLELCKELLNNNSNTFIFFLDGDMSIQQLKQRDVHLLMKKYNNRFNYFGKDYEHFQEKSQELISDIVALQKKNSDRIYVVIQDSLSLTAKKKFGFIDTEKLYENDKELRKYGGNSVIIHHTNKNGVFADSQHIMNFCDYSFFVKRQDFNLCILIEKQKASRFDIKSFAFKVDDRKIIEKIDFDIAKIDKKDIAFINYVNDALEDAELNQSQIIKYLEEVRFFSEFKIGKTKTMKLLKEHSKIGNWSYEQRVDKKNSIVYFLNNSKKAEKLEKLKNTKDFEDETN